MRTFDELSDEFWDDETLQNVNVEAQYYDKYLNELNEILENDSSNMDVLKLKIFILHCQSKYEESLDVCDLALRKAPDDVEVLNDKAFNLYFLRRYKETVDICQRVLDIDPKNEDALQHWDSAILMSDDNTLPKPPKSLLSKIIKILLIIDIFGIICYMLIKYYW